MTHEEIEREIEQFESKSERFTQSDPSRILLVMLTRAVWELASQAAVANELLEMRLLENSAPKTDTKIGA